MTRPAQNGEIIRRVISLLKVLMVQVERIIGTSTAPFTNAGSASPYAFAVSTSPAWSIGLRVVFVLKVWVIRAAERLCNLQQPVTVFSVKQAPLLSGNAHLWRPGRGDLFPYIRPFLAFKPRLRLALQALGHAGAVFGCSFVGHLSLPYRRITGQETPITGPPFQAR